MKRSQLVPRYFVCRGHRRGWWWWWWWWFVVVCLLACFALPCLALPCLALPCLALPCVALPCLALPCLPCLALPCLACFLVCLFVCLFGWLFVVIMVCLVSLPHHAQVSADILWESRTCFGSVFFFGYPFLVGFSGKPKGKSTILGVPEQTQTHILRGAPHKVEPPSLACGTPATRTALSQRLHVTCLWTQLPEGFFFSEGMVLGSMYQTRSPGCREARVFLSNAQAACSRALLQQKTGLDQLNVIEDVKEGERMEWIPRNRS